MSVNIKVKNFQSISDADITVDGFTILVGESSQGKSACLRAVNAACNNKFKQGFLKYGTDSMTIGITYSDEPYSLVVRKTKKESPEYELGELVFQKLNRTVPPEVEAFNNFGSIDSYEQKYPLNFFTQFSKPLLLEFSQKRILEILSSSKAFDDMNDANSKLNKKKEQNSGAFKQVSSMINENKKQLSEYSEQEQAIREDIKSLTDRFDTLKSVEAEISTADELYMQAGTHAHVEERAERLKTVLALCQDISDLNGKADSLVRLQDSIAEQDNAEKATKAAQERLSLSERYISLSEQRKAVRDDLLGELENHIRESRDAHTRIKELSSVLTLAEKAVEVRKSLNATDANLNSLTRLSELMDTYRTVHKTVRDKQSMIDNHICPVCGNKIM